MSQPPTDDPPQEPRAEDDGPVTDQEGEQNVEEPIRSTYESTAREGSERLSRSWRMLMSTGFLGGVEISIGVLAYLLTVHDTKSQLLGALAFSIGFMALFLAHSELFTEGFYYPIVAIFAREGTVLQLIRLWAITLVTNLLGGWLTMGLVVVALPQLHDTLAESTHYFLGVGLSWRGVSLAVLAGVAITLMTRMQAGTDSPGAAIAASVAGAFILAGAPLFHSVLDSIILFGAIQAGVEGATYRGWLGWVWWVIPLNVLGGLVLTTGPRLLRSSKLRPDDDEAPEQPHHPSSLRPDTA